MSDYATWMATFEVDLQALRTLLPLLAPTTHEKLELQIPNAAFVMEVITFGDINAVLLSTADSAANPINLRCWMGFCSDVGWCDRFRGFGIPMVEAAVQAKVTTSRTTLEVQTSFYPHGKDLGLKTGLFLHIDYAAPGAEGTQERKVVYNQFLPRPDLNHPGFEIEGEQRAWESRRQVQPLKGQSPQFWFEPALFPNFESLWQAPASKNAVAMFAGKIADMGGVLGPSTGAGAGVYAKAAPRKKPVSMNKPGSIGAPGYRFENIELFGFRIDIPPPKKLEKETDILPDLIRPLNFHLDSQAGSEQRVDDFKYCVATRSIIVELLRYGKMMYRDIGKPLSPDNYMSQHELLVRLLVGRVDQDAAQARDAATYVATIFVDSPSSKAVGRDLQGYPKKLAHFCREQGTDPEAVRGDGTLNGAVIPLEQISTIRLATDMRAVPSSLRTPILDIAYSVHGFSDADLQPVDPSMFASSSPSADLPWRQADFDSPAFRRAFARDVVSQGLQRARSVQVVPLDAAGDGQTWLTGSFQLTKIRLQRPSGIATLTFHPGLDESDAWAKLSEFLTKSTGTPSVSLPSGDWYHIKCDMDLTIDDGLAW